MKAPARYRQRAAMALLCLAVALGAGCRKQRASLNLKKLKDLVNEAGTNEAEKFGPQDFEAVKKQQTQAQDSFNAQQWPVAYEQSRTTIQSAEAMLEKVKKERSAALQNRADQDIKIAQENSGQTEDPQRYKLILEARDKGGQRYTKSDWDGAINRYLEVINGVDELLAPLKTKAEQRMKEIETKVKGMETDGVREHAVQLGLDVDELVNSAKDLIQNQRQYTTAQTVMSRTEMKINEAIEKAKEVRSLIAINAIETDLDVAMRYGAYVFFLRQLEDYAEAYENILRAFEERKFDNCLLAADLLKPRAAELRFETRKQSAKTKADSLESTIAKLTEGGAREYLPGSVEILDQMLKDARAQIGVGEEKGFDQAEDIAEAANEEYQRILADFNELANKAIASANHDLDVATQIFRATDRIFDVPVPPERMTELERQLETNKQAMKAEIQALLDAARKTLGTSQLKRDAQQYRDSILLAEGVQKTAQIIQDETYRVVAHNSLLEIQAQVTYYDAEAQQYVPETLAEARRLLQETRALIERGESKKAVDEAALAKAQLDVLKQDLASLGARGIVEAQQSLTQAMDHKALQYASDRVAEARANIEKALAARNLFNYRDVIERTHDAKALAEAARSYADRQGAEAQLSEAKSRFEGAEKAYAALYSPEKFKEAGDELTASQQLFDGGKYDEAARLAEAAARRSDEAAFERVIRAEQDIANAKRYNAWRYASRKVADSINFAKQARRQADLGDFEIARGYADESIRLSSEASIEAKGAEVATRLGELRKGVDDAMRGGANYFQVAEVKSLMDRIAQVEATYRPDQYESAEKDLRDMEARLAELLINTPAVLERAVIEQTTRRQRFLDSPIDIRTYAGEDLDESEEALRYAKVDFDKGQYRQSYTNLRKAIRLLDQVDDILSTSDYNSKIAQLFADFVQAQDDFRQILSLSEMAVLQLAINTPNGRTQAVAISGENGPIAFRAAIDRMYKRAEAIKPPPSKATTHERVMVLFLTARRAAMNFEKLVILDQFDTRTAREIITEGFKQLKAAREQQQLIEKSFREPGTDSLIVRTRKALGVQLY